MKGLNLTTEILALYGLEEERLKGSLTLESDLSQEGQKMILEAIDKSLEVRSFDIRIKRKVFNICIELTQFYIKNQEHILNNKSILTLNFNKEYIETKFEIIVKTGVIKKDIAVIDEYNDLSTFELKKKYKSLPIITGFRSNNPYPYLNWLNLRRKPGSPIEYKIESYKSEYSIFEITVKVNIFSNLGKRKPTSP